MKLYPRKTYKAHKEKYFPDKWEKYCPFCDEEGQKEYTLWVGDFWKIVHNKFPFAWSSKHLLAIPLRCERYTKKLTPEEWSEFGSVETFMKDFYGDSPYISFIREVGEIKSIHHLHYHFIPWELPSEPLIENMKEQGFEEILEEI